MSIRKSPARKQLTGTVRRDRPARKMAAASTNGAAAEPPDEEPPAHLSEGAAKEWRRLAPVARQLRTLTPSDYRAFEVLCDALATAGEGQATMAREGWTVSTADGGIKPHPAVRIMEAASNRAARLLDAFGLTPRGRAALDLLPMPTASAPGRPGDRTLDEFLARDPDLHRVPPPRRPQRTLQEFLASDPDLHDPPPRTRRRGTAAH
jgi:P27 family predicted phage terminase small subunit